MERRPRILGQNFTGTFSFVGRLKGLKYTYEGVTYQAPVHGFARDTEFAMIKQDANSMTFEIKDTEKTWEVYPFAFTFQIKYVLEGMQLKVEFAVSNPGKKEMFFSLGGHPAFACPLDRETEKRADYCIGFYHEGKALSDISCRDVNLQTGLVLETYQEYALEDGLLPISDDMFADDALVLENQIDQVTLVKPNGKPYVTFKMDAPVYGIWSSVKPASPFICIEPWYGRCDAENYTGTFEEREYQHRLEPGEKFTAAYTVVVA